uniref:Uncharacterized protein n=1 Tax=Bactrocera latifrons TaxID=174628 RepID=A0A0K8VI53_BACLA
MFAVIEDVEGGGNGGECGYIGADNNREALEANNNASDVYDATVSNIPQTVFQSESTVKCKINNLSYDDADDNDDEVADDASHLNTDATERDVHAVDDGKDIDDYLSAELRADVTTASTITSDATVATTTEAENVLLENVLDNVLL